MNSCEEFRGSGWFFLRMDGRMGCYGISGAGEGLILERLWAGRGCGAETWRARRGWVGDENGPRRELAELRGEYR